MTQRTEPSPEVKKILGEFCRIQREKYGDDWKAIPAKEMSAKTTPFLQALLKLQNSE
jgi:hypothetical protein